MAKHTQPANIGLPLRDDSDAQQTTERSPRKSGSKPKSPKSKKGKLSCQSLAVKKKRKTKKTKEGCSDAKRTPVATDAGLDGDDNLSLLSDSQSIIFVDESEEFELLGESSGSSFLSKSASSLAVPLSGSDHSINAKMTHSSRSLDSSPRKSKKKKEKRRSKSVTKSANSSCSSLKLTDLEKKPKKTKSKRRSPKGAKDSLRTTSMTSKDAEAPVTSDNLLPNTETDVDISLVSKSAHAWPSDEDPSLHQDAQPEKREDVEPVSGASLHSVKSFADSEQREACTFPKSKPSSTSLDANDAGEVKLKKPSSKSEAKISQPNDSCLSGSMRSLSEGDKIEAEAGGVIDCTSPKRHGRHEQKRREKETLGDSNSSLNADVSQQATKSSGSKQKTSKLEADKTTSSEMSPSQVKATIKAKNKSKKRMGLGEALGSLLGEIEDLRSTPLSPSTASRTSASSKSKRSSPRRAIRTKSKQMSPVGLKEALDYLAFQTLDGASPPLPRKQPVLSKVEEGKQNQTGSKSTKSPGWRRKDTCAREKGGSVKSSPQS